MQNTALHYAYFSNTANAQAAHTALQQHTLFNSNKVNILLCNINNSIHITRKYKKHKKAVLFVDDTIELFWDTVNSNNTDDSYDVEGSSDVVDAEGHSTY